MREPQVPTGKLSSSRASIIGRSSSHFTRVVRMFALEVGVDCELSVVESLMTDDQAVYADNPALAVPSLRIDNQVFHGSLNCCRELAKAATHAIRIHWPEQCETATLCNAHELVQQAMTAQVALIMSSRGGVPDGIYRSKLQKRLRLCLDWLENNWPEVHSQFPKNGTLSILELTLFCCFEHLSFNPLLATQQHHRLSAFCREFGNRPSAQLTPYIYDASQGS